MSSSREGKIYVGNLPNDVRERDIEDLFYKFGKIASINLKMGSTDLPFAFIEFEDPRDARDAISDRDGYNFQGYSLRVERPHGGRGGMRGGRGGYGGPPPYRGRSDYRSSEYSRGSSGGGGGASNGSRRSDYRVLVSGLPASGSWQDLKDHMREAGDVCYTDVFKDGTGVVEFVRLDDMKYAVRKLDDSKFRSHEGESSRIRVKEDYKGGHSRSRSRSHSPVSRSRSRRSSSR